MVRGLVVLLARGAARFDPTRQLLSTTLLLGLTGCPHQELAPLVPCTVSVVSIDATQSGTDQVDLLFVIDNSGSMSEEQVKLNAQLPRLVQALTSGDLDGMPNPNGQQDFRPVGSLRLAVVSTDLGANGVTGIRSCGSNSYAATEQNMSAQGVDNVDRPFGDDALLLNSTAVATAGVTTAGALGVGNPMQAVAPRPECALQVPRVLEYPAGGTAAEIAQRFSCVAELGVNGCAIEQQLESMWKSLAPNTDRSFSRGSGGHGTPPGANAGFLRPEAILAVIVVTDEEDCSSPDANAQTLYSSADLLQINLQCGRQAALLQPVARYINGLKSLKSEAFQDRVIFAGIVGVPLAATTRGMSLDQILARPEMQFTETGGVFGGTVRPVCTARGGAGSATPARRIVEVARGFAENGVITSICEDDYGAALDAVIAKIAGKLSGECLPRRLTRNGDGLVACRVVELKTAGDRTPCDPARGRIAQLRDRPIDGIPRVTCEIAQLRVQGATQPQGVGWYYDDFSNEVNRCTVNRQRIAFTPAAGIDNGASARFECFRAVAAEPSDPAARGIEAINTSCADTVASSDPRRPAASGNARCQMLSTSTEPLVCASGTCQLRCMVTSDCPAPMACSASDGGAGICVNPTCPGE
jgi:hypothetical protein